MRDKLSIAAFVVSAVAFLVILVTPAPKAPPESASTRSEGIVNRGQAERTALDEDIKELDQLKNRAKTLASMREGSRPDKDKTDKLIARMIASEIKRQLPAFERQLKIIRLYEKKAPEKPAPEKQTLDQKVPARRTTTKNAANDPDAQKKDAIRAKISAERAKRTAQRKAALAKARAARKKAAEKKAEQNKVEGAPE